MPKTATINARVDEHLKADAERVLSSLGVSTTDAITMFPYQVVLHQGLPFDVRLPNAGTQAAMAELDAGQGDRFGRSTKSALAFITITKR
jgi:DNA-damage-inducible protein J